jgi:hypothetical protein
MQKLPDVFTPPYPLFGAPQTSKINTAAPKPPREDGPGYGDGQGVGRGKAIGSSLAGIEAQKTQFPGSAQAAAAGAPAQLIARVGADGLLHFTDNVTNKTF